VTAAPWSPQSTRIASRSFRDLNVDLGGFLKKDKLWWYGAYRRTNTGQRYPTLVDDVQETGCRWHRKVTYNVMPNQKLIGSISTPTRISRTISARSRCRRARNASDHACRHGVAVALPTDVWKVEYNAVLSSSLLLELRAAPTSRCGRVWKERGAPRRGHRNNFVSGGVTASTSTAIGRRSTAR